MKFALMILVLAFPMLAAAGASNQAPKYALPCRFSKLAADHAQIEYSDKGKCEKLICAHVVVCDGNKFAHPVYCKPKDGKCEGYTADYCVKNLASADAEYDTEKRTP